MPQKQNEQELNSNPDFTAVKKQVNRLQKIVFFLCIILFAGILSNLFIFSTNNSKPKIKAINDKVEVSDNLPQIIGLPTELPVKDFAGELVPYADFEVRERVDREILNNTFSHSRTMIMMKRAGRWFPIIEPILKKNGVPSDLKYVAVIESDLTNATSPVGATGFWQFMKTTGAEFGLEISEEVDERYSVEKSTEAACQYFKKAYAKFNSWTLAAASYNMGVAGVSNSLKEQNQLSYYELFLNQETSRYVARIIAVKSLFSNPKAYGFMIKNADLYPVIPTKILTVTTSIPDLNTYAVQNGTNLKMLKELNPWLRKSMLTNNKSKFYEIKIPTEGFNYDQSQKAIKGILPE